MSEPKIIQGELPAARRRVIVIASRFNEFVVSGLVKGARFGVGEAGWKSG